MKTNNSGWVGCGGAFIGAFLAFMIVVMSLPTSPDPNYAGLNALIYGAPIGAILGYIILTWLNLDMAKQKVRMEQNQAAAGDKRRESQAPPYVAF